MAGQSFWHAHPHLAWATWGLDEIEATLASFERQIHKHADAHKKAESAIADMHTARDAFRKSIDEHGRANEADLARWKEGLESQWVAFEDGLDIYLETVGKQITEQETVFRARADAQSKAWQQAIGKLHENAASFAANRRGDVEAAVKRLESEADAAKAKLDKLNNAEGTSWAAMKSALAETRAALDRAHKAVVDAFERAS
jgi:chromosome segregation ATPase